MKWHNINETAPPEMTPVLVRAHDGTITAAKYAPEPGGSMLFWEGVGMDGYEWDWDWDQSLPWRGVTHWAELPQFSIDSA